MKQHISNNTKGVPINTQFDRNRDANGPLAFAWPRRRPNADLTLTLTLGVNPNRTLEISQQNCSWLAHKRTKVGYLARFSVWGVGSGICLGKKCN